MGRDIPIIFSAPMVRALLDGRKTMTRRLASSPLRKCIAGDRLWVRETISGCPDADGFDGLKYAADSAWSSIPGAPSQEAMERFLTIFNYRGKRGAPVPAIHMPRWASRLTLVITHTKIERLQDISAVDAEAEGPPPCRQCHDVGWINSGPDGGWQCEEPGCGDADINQFARLWVSLHGKNAWADNPEVVALSFQVIDANIDAPELRAA